MKKKQMHDIKKAKKCDVATQSGRNREKERTSSDDENGKQRKQQVKHKRKVNEKINTSFDAFALLWILPSWRMYWMAPHRIFVASLYTFYIVYIIRFSGRLSTFCKKNKQLLGRIPPQLFDKNIPFFSFCFGNRLT